MSAAVRDYFGAALDVVLGVERAMVEAERAELNALRLAALNGDDEARSKLIELGDGVERDEDDWSS